MKKQKQIDIKMLRFLKKRKGHLSFSYSPMASSSLSSGSSLFFSHLPNANHNPIRTYNSKSRFQLPFRVLGSSASSDQNQELAAVSEKKSFAVATGEIFIGLASRLVKARKKAEGSRTVLMFRETEGPVVGDNDVVWEQRVEDVEAERRRRVVTSPGFSFSAAGLLFPYHLGVAKFLIEKGYIKVRIVSCLVFCVPVCFRGNFPPRIFHFGMCIRKNFLSFCWKGRLLFLFEAKFTCFILMGFLFKFR